MRLLLQIFLLLAIQPSLHTQSSRTINLSGKIYRPADTLVLLKPYEDIRYQGMKIPVASDSTFSFDFKESHVEAYELIFLSDFRSGGWREVIFFTDTDSLHFSLYSLNEFDKNRVSGSALTSQRDIYLQEQISTFSKSYSSLSQELSAFEKGTAEANRVKHQIDSLARVFTLWRHNHLTKTPSVLGLSEYYDILTNVHNSNLTSEDLDSLHQFWQDRFPENSLTPIVIATYNSLTQNESSSTFHDFDLLTEANKVGSLSAVISDSKYTLLDLWSPWCGPCLKKSKQVQKEYANLLKRGLTVIGVVGGITDVEAYSLSKQKHNYPWEVYREIKDEQGIWHKYGITYSGGRQFLIDSSGNILAAHPTVDEILAIIEK